MTSDLLTVKELAACKMRAISVSSFNMPSPHPQPLTPRQRRFIAEYALDSNATQAAIRAGYSAKTAPQAASRLLRQTGVVNSLDAKVKVIEQKIIDHAVNKAIGKEEIIDNLARIARKLPDEEKLTWGDVRMANVDLAKIAGMYQDSAPAAQAFQINIVIDGGNNGSQPA